MWMGFQNEIGVDVPVDGEMYRGDMVAYFAEEMDGFETGGFVRSYGNRFYRKPIITGRGPLARPDDRRLVALRSVAHRQARQGDVHRRLHDHGLVVQRALPRSASAAALALAREFRKEVEALVEAGCKIIQVDEPAVSVRADEIDIAIEAMQITTEGIDAYFITHALEYGYPETVFPDVLDLAVDNFDMEFANSDFAFLESLKGFGFDKDLSLGVVDSHTHKIETVDEVEASASARRSTSCRPRPSGPTRTADSRPAPSTSRWARCAPSREATKRVRADAVEPCLSGPSPARSRSSRGRPVGWGRGTAAHLASLGAKVAVCYVRSKDIAEELAGEITGGRRRGRCLRRRPHHRGRSSVTRPRSGRALRRPGHPRLQRRRIPAQAVRGDDDRGVARSVRAEHRHDVLLHPGGTSAPQGTPGDGS